MKHLITYEEHIYEKLVISNYDQEFLKKISQRIFAIAAEKEISLQAMSDLMGIDQQSLYRYKRRSGTLNPSILFLKSVADALQIRVADLFESNETSIGAAPI